MYGLPLDFDYARLHALFSLHGEIMSCKIMYDFQTGASKGYGFVRYVNADGATSAISAFHRKKLSASSEQVLTVYIAQDNGRHSFAECVEVYVTNVPLHVDKAMIQHAFSKYGNIVDIRILRSGGFSVSSKGAFVQFSTVAEAQHAVCHIHGSRPFGTSEQGLLARFAETADARVRRQWGHSQSQQPVVGVLPPPPPQPFYQQPFYQQPMYYHPQPVYYPGTCHPGMQLMWYQ